MRRCGDAEMGAELVVSMARNSIPPLGLSPRRPRSGDLSNVHQEVQGRSSEFGERVSIRSAWMVGGRQSQTLPYRPPSLPIHPPTTTMTASDDERFLQEYNERVEAAKKRQAERSKAAELKAAEERLLRLQQEQREAEEAVARVRAESVAESQRATSAAAGVTTPKKGSAKTAQKRKAAEAERSDDGDGSGDGEDEDEDEEYEAQ